MPLPVTSKTPVRIEVVAVVDSTHRSTAIAPRLSVLMGMQVNNGSINVTLVDMENRKISSAPVVMGKLSLGQLWKPLRTPLPPAIDHRDDAQFFVSEVRKRLEQPDTDTPPTLIVLSAPERFGKGEDLKPIQASMPPAGRAFYIRCVQADNWMALPLSVPFADSMGGGVSLPVSTGLVVHRVPSNADSLERTLKPLRPRVLNVSSAMEFRKALAEIIGEIAR